MGDKLLHITLVLGTARKDRESQKVFRLVEHELKRRDNLEISSVDVREFVKQPVTIPPWEDNPLTTPWRKLAEQTNGFIIVSPEYNHGYPGELKLLLDGAYEEYEKKPVALCGVSNGGFGGARLLDHIKPVLVEFKMIPLRTAVYFSNVEELFDADGALTDTSYTEKINHLIDDMITYLELLQKK